MQFPSQNVHYTEVDGKPSRRAAGPHQPRPRDRHPEARRHPRAARAEHQARRDDALRGVRRRLRRPRAAGPREQARRRRLRRHHDLADEPGRHRHGALRAAAHAAARAASSAPARSSTRREFQGASEKTLVDLGISKTITLTSTYDHRVIQGAGSGEFLKIVHSLLIGEQHFYEKIFAALRVPSDPIHWAQDVNVDLADDVSKTARVQELINSYRVRGHLLADVDPLVYQQRMHPDLDIRNHGLTFWDLDREFVVGGFGGTPLDEAARRARPAARHLLPHGRRRVHAHPGPGAARRGSRRRSSGRTRSRRHNEQMRILAS